MCTGNGIKPTRDPVYLRKKTTSVKAKVVRSATVSPVVVHADSTDAGSGDSAQYEYVIRAKSSRNKQKSKHVECGCGGKCRKESGGSKSLGSDKARIIVRGDSRKHCTCKGRGNDGWLCDACRAAQKTRGVWKFLSCASDSESGHCCCGGCESSGHARGRDDANARFEKEVDTWMKESKQKMKNARSGKLVCNCHRPGCKVCVIVQH